MSRPAASPRYFWGLQDPGRSWRHERSTATSVVESAGATRRSRQILMGWRRTCRRIDRRRRARRCANLTSRDRRRQRSRRDPAYRWQNATATAGMIDRYRPGVDTLAMVTATARQAVVTWTRKRRRSATCPYSRCTACTVHQAVTTSLVPSTGIGKGALLWSMAPSATHFTAEPPCGGSCGTRLPVQGRRGPNIRTAATPTSTTRMPGR